MLPSFLVVVFWAWFAVAGLILVHRLVTRGSLRADDRSDPTSTESERLATAERHAAFEAQLAAFAPTAADHHATHAPEADTGMDREAGDVIEAARERAIPASKPASPSNPEGLLPAAARARTLAEALQGIHMPCELTPVPDDRPDQRRMLFATTTTDASVVGEALADELERIGFDLIPLDDRAVVAVRPEARVEVRILPEDPAVLREAVVARLAPGSVVTEFQLS